MTKHAEHADPKPTMLYKPRDGAPNPQTWDRPFDTQIVDSEGIAAEQAEGWLTAAEVAKADAAKSAKAGK